MPAGASVQRSYTKGDLSESIVGLDMHLDGVSLRRYSKDDYRMFNIFINKLGRIMGKKTVVGKERILETAARLFIKQGYKAVSIRDIARACHVTNAALYYYFPSKEALFWEVIHHHLLQLAEVLDQARQNAAPHPKAQLQAMLTAYTEWVLKKRASFFALRRDIGEIAKGQDEASPRPFLRLATIVIEPFEKVLQQAQASELVIAPPHEATLSNILLAMLHGALHSQKDNSDPRAMAEETAAWVVEVFWRGVARPSDGRGETP